MNDQDAIELFTESSEKYAKVCKIQLLFRQNLLDMQNILYLLAQIKNNKSQQENEIKTIIYQQLIIQFIKFTCDSHLTYSKGDKKLPISAIAQSKGINRLVVDVRNQISHGQIIDYTIYFQCAVIIEQWILEEYKNQLIQQDELFFNELNIQNVNIFIQKFNQSLNQALNLDNSDQFIKICQNISQNKQIFFDNKELAKYLLYGLSYSLRSQISQLDMNSFKNLVSRLKKVSSLQDTITEEMSFEEHLIALLRLLYENRVNPGNVLLFICGFPNIQQLDSRLIHFRSFNSVQLATDRFYCFDNQLKSFYGIYNSSFLNFNHSSDKQHYSEQDDLKSIKSLNISSQQDKILSGIQQINEYMQENGLFSNF